MTEAIYSDHNMGKARLDGFLRVQTLWDETMAQSLADYLVGPGRDRQMVVVAGGNHVRYGFGIPRRLHRRLPVSYALIGSHEIEIPADREAQMMDVKLPKFPLRPWDYLKLTRYEKFDQGVKLGIAIEDSARGVEITRIMPDSAADKAGLQKGDILTHAAQIDIKESFDLLYLLMNQKEGTSLPLSLLRNQEPLDVTATF